MSTQNHTVKTPGDELNPSPEGLGLGESHCSASIGRSQKVAATIWETFKAEDLRYTDMLELIAVLMVNIADKSHSEDIEIIQWTRRLMADMRRNASLLNQ